MTAIGYANDGGGSIRIPASCCGLVGLKPSRGRISVGPDWTELVAGFAIEGVVTRTVADTAAALDVMAGPEAGDPYWAPPPAAPFADAVGREPGKLRIALHRPRRRTASPVDPEPASPRRARRVELLESLGHEVVEDVSFDWDGDAYVENFVKVWMAVTGDEIARLRAAVRPPIDRDELEPLTRADGRDRASRSRRRTTCTRSAGCASCRAEIVGLWDDIDVLLTPTLAQPPIEIGALQPGPGRAGDPDAAELGRAGCRSRRCGT